MRTQSGHKPKIANETSQLQTALLVRAGVYGTACTLYFAITLIYTQCMSDPERGIIETLMKSAEDVCYWLPGFLLLIPVAAHDLMKLSSQMAKPITDLRREFSMLIDGQSERPLAINEGDYWYQLTEAYNQVRGELLQLRKRLGEDNGEDEDDITPVLGNHISKNGSLTVSEPPEVDIEDTVRLAAPPVIPMAMPAIEATANTTV